MRFNLKILDRYLALQFLGPFVLAVGGFLIIGTVDILFVLVDSFVISGVPLAVVTRLLLYKLPAIMVLFFPMAVLFTVMFNLVRMAKDNELTILRASGVPSLRILTPIIILCIFASGLAFLINEKVVPWSNQVSDKLIQQSMRKKAPPNITNNVFFKDKGNRFFYIKTADSKRGILKRVLVFETQGKFPRIISANHATWTDNTWTLYDGFIQKLDDKGALDYSSQFDQINIHVNRSVGSFYSKKRSAKEMDSRSLKDKIDTLALSGINTNTLEVEYHRKFSFPITCLIFGLIGSTFCIRFVRSGKDWWGVIFAIVVAVLLVGFFFFLTAYCNSLGKKGSLPVILAVWLPNMIYGIPSIGIILHDSYYR